MKTILIASLLAVLNADPYYGISEPMYIGIGASGNETHTGTDGFNSHQTGEFSNAGITLVAGKPVYMSVWYDIHVEARAATSTCMEDSEDIKVRTFGAYVKPVVDVPTALNMYALAGVNILKYTGDERQGSQTLVSPSIGAGAEFSAARFSLFVDVVYSFPRADLNFFSNDVTHYSITPGIVYKF